MPGAGSAVYSTEYVYNDGRITAANLFMRPDSSMPYSGQAKAEFAYNNAGNLSGLRSFVLKKHLESGFELVSETGFIYDDKVNPLGMGMDALVLDHIFFVSNNNIIRIEIINATNPAAHKEVLDFVYQYHTSSKPR